MKVLQSSGITHDEELIEHAIRLTDRKLIDRRAQGGVGVRCARQRPEHVDAFFGIPTQLSQIRVCPVVDQPEAAHTGHLRPFGHGLIHALDGSADRLGV